ncbi:MAG: hypothetical protein FWE97_02845, partial [Dehalococcoidia bacterium]|nr:hypothetical protein [Dehalococcoidia bacterium]
MQISGIWNNITELAQESPKTFENAYKHQLLERLREFIDTSKITMNAKRWEIDKVNHMGVEVFDDSTIVYFSSEHEHFWRHDNSADYDFIDKTTSFMKGLLTGQTLFERSYCGEKLVSMAYYIKANGSGEWALQQKVFTALFRNLFRFPEKVHKTEIIEF